jgi:hypothetical protein
MITESTQQPAAAFFVLLPLRRPRPSTVPIPAHLPLPSPSPRSARRRSESSLSAPRPPSHSGHTPRPPSHFASVVMFLRGFDRAAAAARFFFLPYFDLLMPALSQCNALRDDIALRPVNLACVTFPPHCSEHSRPAKSNLVCAACPQFGLATCRTWGVVVGVGR